MTSESQKKFLRGLINRGDKPYCALVANFEKGKGTCEDVGFINSNIELNSKVAAFAAKHKVSRVKVLTGHNIMSCGDGPSAIFDVEVSVG